MTQDAVSASQELDQVVDWTIDRVGPRLIVGMPLALGKPNALANAFYQRARRDPEISLELVTALSLNPPTGSSELERRFLAPFVQRHFGADYPRLEYVDDLTNNRLPDNVTVTEFYFQSGSRLHNSHAQRHYVSSNYTHVARDFADRGANVLLQLVAAGNYGGRPMLSLSSNPDVSSELRERLHRDADYPFVFIAQIHEHLPFMHGEALVEPEFFDRVIKARARHRLFAVPRGPVTTQDHALGLHASTLIADNGTLQIGIGSLGDALVNALILRHQDNGRYRQTLTALAAAEDPGASLGGDLGAFERGLFGASEMFLDGFMHLHEAGILKREVYEDLTLQTLADHGNLPPAANRELIEAMWSGGSLSRQLNSRDLLQLQTLGIIDPHASLDADDLLTASGSRIENDWSRPHNRDQLAASALADRIAPGIVLEAAFFLGSAPFYQWLNDLDEVQRPRFVMSPVAKINQLYGGREALELRQRRNARFVNTTMMMTLTGAAVSDGLANYQMVSGVGGQYNFVAMAHAMAHGRSVLLVRSTRGEGSERKSNIVWDYPHITIPRHLRDLVVTEYGVANLRGRSDEQCIEAMIEIADSQFQAALASTAKAAGKLRQDYTVPEHARRNTPETLQKKLQPVSDSFDRFPFGHDFDPVEISLVKGLGWLKSHANERLKLLGALVSARPDQWPQEMQHMGLEQPTGIKGRLLRRMVAAGLQQSRQPG